MHEIYPPPYNPSKRDTVNTDYDRCVACVGVGELLWPDRYRVGAHKIVAIHDCSRRAFLHKHTGFFRAFV